MKSHENTQRGWFRDSIGSTARKGTILICVLACLAVISAAITMTAQSALRSRNEVRSQRQLLQTQFLCEAGVLRAKQQLQKLSSYSGEEWSPSISPSFNERAIISIQIETIADASIRLVKVVAKLADTTSSVHLIQQSHQFKIDLVNSIPKELK